MKALVAERDRLTVVLLPGCAPDLHPVEGLWAHIKRSLANLATRTLSELEPLQTGRTLTPKSVSHSRVPPSG